MITIILPEPLAWLLAINGILYVFNGCLEFYIWYLKRKLAKEGINVQDR